MSSVIPFVLLIVVVSIHAEVILHDVGKLTVVVEEEYLHLVVTEHKKCRGDLDIHYHVTNVNDTRFAVAGDNKLCRMRSPDGALATSGYDGNSTCPLAKTGDNHLVIIVVSLPGECIVALKNAELMSSATKHESEQSLHTALTIGSVLGALILIGLAVALFAWFVGRSWWGRRQERKRRPVESPVNGPSSLLKMPEETNTRKRNGKKNNATTELKISKNTPATVTPTVSAASIVRSDDQELSPAPSSATQQEKRTTVTTVNLTEPKKGNVRLDL